MTKLASDVARVLYRRPNGLFALSTVPKDKANEQRGFYDFPGGKIDEGETSDTAAAREMLEEGWAGKVEPKPFYTTRLPSVIGDGDFGLTLHRGKGLKQLGDYKEKYRGVLPVWGSFDDAAARQDLIGKAFRQRQQEILEAYQNKRANVFKELMQR